MIGVGGPLGRRLGQAGFRRVILGAVAALVVAAAFLPPLSLLHRLGIVGYETLDAENTAVSHSDGLTLRVASEAFTDRLRVRLESVPQLAFLEGSAGSELKEAAEDFPEHLEVKSPYYKIDVRGTASHPVWLDVVVPNDAEPWQTLDLYSWDGAEWRWLGSELHDEAAGEEFVRATVTDVPASVVVVQSGPSGRWVATDLTGEDASTQADLFDAVHPTGLLLGTMGGFAGDVDELPLPDESADCAVLPTLRNWAPGGSVNAGLLRDFLNDAAAQEAHIDAAVEMCNERGFDGVVVDYRSVTVEQRDAFVSFVHALADALHEAGLQLDVRVEHPKRGDGGWDSGGFDLAELGEAADRVHVPFPSDPEAYAEGGEAHRLLDWATAQVSRQKLVMLVSSLSTTMAEGSDAYQQVSASDALEPLGRVALLDETEEVDPQTEVALGLSGSLLSTSSHQAAGTYSIRHRAEEGGVRTTWLGTADSLANKLSWARQYHLGGVAVVDALDPGNMEGVVDVVTAYPDTESLALPTLEDIGVAWTVTQGEEEVDRAEGAITNPSYTWIAEEEPGVYTVGATVIGFDHGSVDITVAAPSVTEPVTGTITETETITGTDTITETAETPETSEEGEGAGDTEAPCPSAKYLADVTVPDNTQMEPGEAFEKTWQVENSGSCAWPDDAVLAFIGGDQLGAPDTVDVPAVEPGEEKDITVPMEAPAEDGTYTGKWQLRSEEGAFGGQLWVTIVVGEPQQASPEPAPAPTGGGSFELGGHIRDWGFPYADKMHYAGMTWAKVQVQYPQDASGIIGAAHANGFKIQVSALGPASMVTESGFEQKVADWVAGIAAAGADAIEIWNEPNIDREWQMGHIGPQAYTNLLCASYRAIKNANRNTAVISGAPAPTGSFGGGCQPNGGNCDDIPFLRGMYNAGAAQCMDYIGAHHNSGATSPSARSGHPADGGGGHHSWYFLPQTELYYNAFGGTRKVFYTEMGYASQEGVPPFSDHFSWARGTNNAQQAAWLKEAVQLSINTGMVRCIIVWNIDYVRYGYDPQDGYAIIRPGGSCPACEALHSVLGTR